MSKLESSDLDQLAEEADRLARTPEARALTNIIAKSSMEIKESAEKIAKSIDNFNKSTTALTIIIILFNSILAFSTCIGVFTKYNETFNVWILIVSLVVFFTVGALSLWSYKKIIK